MQDSSLWNTSDYGAIYVVNVETLNGGADDWVSVGIDGYVSAWYETVHG